MGKGKVNCQSGGSSFNPGLAAVELLPEERGIFPPVDKSIAGVCSV